MPHLGQYTTIAVLWGCMTRDAPCFMLSPTLRMLSPKLPPPPCLDCETQLAIVALGEMLGMAGLCHRNPIGLAHPNSEFCITPKPRISWSRLSMRASAETVRLMVLLLASSWSLL